MPIVGSMDEQNVIHTQTVELPTPLKRRKFWGAWVAQSVKHLTLAQVIISQFVGSSPALGSALRAEPAYDSLSLSLSLSASPPITCVWRSLSLKINK